MTRPVRQTVRIRDSVTLDGSTLPELDAGELLAIAAGESTTTPRNRRERRALAAAAARARKRGAR